MKLSEYLDMDEHFPSPDPAKKIPRHERRRILAKKVKCHHFYIYQLETGRRRGSPEMAALISQATGGKVGVVDMIPALRSCQDQGTKAATSQEHPSPNPG